MKITLFIFLTISQLSIAQKQKTFKTCAKNVTYTVDDWELRKKVGMDLELPSSNPEYIGGTKELTKFFNGNQIEDSNYAFRTFIYFVINCKGELGEFKLLNGEDSDVSRKQLLEIAKKMPRKWKPAVSKEGKPVDSYQIIKLTNTGSKVTDVQYK